MGRTFGGPFPSLILQRFASGRKIKASDLQALVEAINWIHARGMTAVSQAWEDDIFARSAALYSASPQAFWRIPSPGGAKTILSGRVWCTRVGGAGSEIKLASATSGSTTTHAPPAGPGWVSIGPITCDFTAGYDDIELSIKGDGADPVIIDSVYLEFAPYTSPLAAGVVGTFAPFDLDEVGDDRPISADVTYWLRTTLEDLLARNRVYYTWSGLYDCDDPSAAARELPPWAHRAWARPIPGALQGGLRARLWANVSNPAAVDEYVTIHHAGLGSGPQLRGTERYKMKVNAGFSGWQTAQLELGEDDKVPGGYRSPNTSLNIEATDIDLVRSLTIWGR